MRHVGQRNIRVCGLQETHLSSQKSIVCEKGAASSLLLPPLKASTGRPLSHAKKTVSQQSLSCLVCSSSHDVCEPQNPCHAVRVCVCEHSFTHRIAERRQELVDEWWAQAAKEIDGHRMPGVQLCVLAGRQCLTAQCSVLKRGSVCASTLDFQSGEVPRVFFYKSATFLCRLSSATRGVDGNDTHRWTDFVASSLDSLWIVLSAEPVPKMDSGSRISDQVATMVVDSMPCRSERNLPCLQTNLFRPSPSLKTRASKKASDIVCSCCFRFAWAVLADRHHEHHGGLKRSQNNEPAKKHRFVKLSHMSCDKQIMVSGKIRS